MFAKYKQKACLVAELSSQSIYLYLLLGESKRLPVRKTFRLDEIVEAHRFMEENKAMGKTVVLV